MFAPRMGANFKSHALQHPRPDNKHAGAKGGQASCSNPASGIDDGVCEDAMRVGVDGRASMMGLRVGGMECAVGGCVVQNGMDMRRANLKLEGPLDRKAV